MACIAHGKYLSSPAQFDEKAVRKEKEQVKLFSLTDLFWDKDLCLFVSFITAQWLWGEHYKMWYKYDSFKTTEQ